MNAPELLPLAQAAVVAAWIGHEPLVDFLGGPHVFDLYVPEGVFVTRYIIVGEQNASPVNVMAARGSSTTMAAGAWTRGEPDRAAVTEIVRLMDEAAAGPLPLAGFESAYLENEFTTVLAGETPDLHHAPVRYRINAVALA